MRCKSLASDWLTAVSVTVIIPIQFTERHTEKGRMRERDREREYEREGEGEPMASLWVSG